MSAKDGGPAFPNITPEMEIQGGPGMSLRDYFAAKALGCFTANEWPDPADAQYISEGAYAIADAMLAQRAKVQP